MHLKLQREQLKKTADATGELISKIKKSSKTLQQNTKNSYKQLKAVTNEHDKEIPKERYMSQEERQKIIDDLILMS